MLKYTPGKWSWGFAGDGNKPCIRIDDGKNETTSLRPGDMQLMIHAPEMFELLWKFAKLDYAGYKELLRLANETQKLLKHINVEPQGENSHVQ